MRLSTFTLITVVGFFFAGLQLTMGQNNDQTTAIKAAKNGQHTEVTAQGIRYMANGSLIVRDSPPSLFSFKGKQIGTLEKTQQFFISDRRKIGYFFGEQEWVKIHDPQGKITGWVYNGETKAGTPYIGPQ